MRRGTRTISLALSLMAVSSCASGKTIRSDRISDRKSSLRVRVPSAKENASGNAVPVSARVPATEGRGKLTPAQHAALKAKVRSWSWPTTDVQITSRFGSRDGEHHDGIDLRAATGTPVLAAAPGKVIYADQKIRGYGKMVVLKHDSRLSTVYAHNSKLYVKRGQQVRRGQKIALSGNTGRSTGPHLHFEIREGVTAINPASLLPSPDVIREVNRRIANRTASYRVKTTQSKAASRDEAASSRRPSKRYRQYSTDRKAKTLRTSQSSSTRAAAATPKNKSAVTARPAARLASGDGFAPKKHRPTPTTTPGSGG